MLKTDDLRLFNCSQYFIYYIIEQDFLRGSDKMKRFKTYLENRISLLNTDLEKLMKRIDSLPPETEIIIENYGDISELKKKCNKYFPTKSYLL